MELDKLSELNSDTSDDEEINQIMANIRKPKNQLNDSNMDAESVALSTSTFRTKNEIDQNDIDQIIKFMPKMVEKEIGSINKLGVVKSFLPPHILFVEKDNDTADVLDLDNFVCNEQKELIGYIDEVVGPIKDPFYAVVLYPAFKESLEKQELDLDKYFKALELYYVEKTK